MSNRRKPNSPWLARGEPGTRYGVKNFPRRENRRRKQMRLRAENVKGMNS